MSIEIKSETDPETRSWILALIELGALLGAGVLALALIGG